VRLSLQNRIFIVLGSIAILSLSIVWFVIRPKYESSVITERLTIIQQLQTYSIENLDQTIARWSDVTRFISWQVTEHPNEGEIVLRTMMTLHPEIIQIKIQSPKFADALSSHNTEYPAIKLQVPPDAWIRSKIDTLLSIAWITDTTLQKQYFVTQTRFRVQQIPFTLLVIWDAKDLQTFLSRLPLGEDFSVRIQSTTSVLFENQSSFRRIESPISEEHFSRMSTLHQEKITWQVLTSAFRTAQFWMIVAIPESTILKSVRDLLMFSTSLILSLICILLILGWLLAHQIGRPIVRLVNDVQRLSNLDFTQKIQIPQMKDLRNMGETIELMRQVLERYQRMNVEKIIFEEWKNKLFISHSDDMIGLTDGTGTFVFRNEKLEEFCSSLIPTRPLKSKSDILTHPSITKLKETLREAREDSLYVHFSQSEMKIDVDETVTTYYRLNDLTIVRNEENLGSLLIFHDLTNERMVDKMKTEMINVVVHELRNPVGSIMGFAEILLNDPHVTDDERKEFLGHMLGSTKNLSQLINRFLDISRLESRRVEYPKVPTDVVTIVKTIVETQKPQLMTKSLIAEFEAFGKIPEINISPDLYREAVSNLLSNAIKYGDQNRTINMTLAQESNNVVFTITDHGYGISAQAQEKLFTKFFRVHNPKASGEIGTGLGLAYVKEIVAYHNGTISLESNEEIGCKFTLSIPIAFEEQTTTAPHGGQA
jgi:signal transduction histidine kinase